MIILRVFEARKDDLSTGIPYNILYTFGLWLLKPGTERDHSDPLHFFLVLFHLEIILYPALNYKKLDLGIFNSKSKF